MPTERVDIAAAMEHKTPEYAAINPLQRHASARARRRHDHHGVDCDLPIFRNACVPSRRYSASAPKMPRSWRCGIDGQKSIFLASVRRGIPSHASGDEGAGGAAGARLGGRTTGRASPGSSNCSTANLRHARFVAGDRYTVADITTQVAVDFMKPARPLSARRRGQRETLARRGVSAAERRAPEQGLVTCACQ